MKYAKYILVLLVLIGVAPYLTCARQSSTVASEVSNDQGKTTRVHGIGYLEPTSDIRRLAFESVGVIKTCHVSIGEQVEIGRLLMTLQDVESRAAVTLAEAELLAAKAAQSSVVRGVHEDRINAARMAVELLRAKHQLDEIEFRRIDQLFQGNNAASDEYEKARLELAQTQAAVAEAEAELSHLQGFVRPEDIRAAAARVEIAEANLQLAQVRLSKTELRAPFDGTVLDIHRLAGESAEPAVGVISFGDLSKRRVRAEIDERFVSTIAVGQRATLTSSGRGSVSLNGAIESIKPIMGRKTLFAGSSDERSDLDVVEVFIELEDNATSLPVGFRVEVVVEGDIPPSSSTAPIQSRLGH